MKKQAHELDRLSALPDAIIFHIFSFLDMRVFVQSSILSNRWRIKSLELSSVKLPEGNSNGELIFSFTVMRSLVIRGCSFPGKLKRFTISAPQLERLELTNLFEDWNEPIQVNICTPKLKLLIYTGYIYGDYSLENLSVLVSAEISIWQRSGMEKDLFARYITNVLTGVYNVKKLLMPTWLVKTIAGSWILELLPIIFSNLKSMKLVECNGTDKTCIGEMASFLERLFHLESFVWSRGSQDMELGSIIKGDNSIKSNLKSIEIHNSQVSADELNLLEILLEQSIDLKKIIIKKSKSLSQDKYKLLTFCEKLSNLPQAFSSVKVEIVEDAQDPCFIKI